MTLSPDTNKPESRNTLDSFLKKYKEILSEEESNFNNSALYFDGQFIEMLQHESEEVLKLCKNLNSDQDFIRSLNMIFQPSGESVEGYKAEHLMIADFIKAYNKVAIHENEKGRFALAYFFDFLQGKDLSKGISIQRLNQMATNDSFLKNIGKIKNAKIINTSPEYSDEYLMPSVLQRMQHPLFINSGNIIYRFASIIAKADGPVNEEEKKELRIILEKTSNPRIKTSGIKANKIPEGDNLETVMAELDLL